LVPGKKLKRWGYGKRAKNLGKRKPMKLLNRGARRRCKIGHFLWTARQTIRDKRVGKVGPSIPVTKTTPRKRGLSGREKTGGMKNKNATDVQAGWGKSPPQTKNKKKKTEG